MPTFKGVPDWLERDLDTARKEGRILKDSGANQVETGGNVTTPSAKGKARKRAKPPLVESFKCGHKADWYVGVETRNETNDRSWRGRSARAGQVWSAVRDAVEIKDLVRFEAAIRWQKVYARFTRLAPRTLDKFANLPASLKAVEDVVCFLIGVDDSSPLWNVCCDQEVSEAMGVRIELSLEPFK